jgi:hypothetical protein
MVIMAYTKEKTPFDVLRGCGLGVCGERFALQV